MVANSSPHSTCAISRTIAGVLATLLLIVPPGFGQTNTQGTITGVVTDESGAVLPGVNVTAASPSLQVGQVSAVSDATGEYRLGGLPIGTYEVTYVVDGFQTVKRADIRVT